MYYEEIFFNLREIVGKDERVLWYGKPDKKCFILESIFNILLPFALLWGTIATLFLYQIFSHPEKVHNNPGSVSTIIFFAIWLSPVWIYLYGCFTSPFEYKNVGYIITDKALYRSKGLILEKIEKVEYSEIKSVKINIGFLDKLLEVGCVDITTHFYKVEYVNFQKTISDFSIRNIKGAEGVYQIIKNAMTEFEFNYPKKEVEKVNKIDLQSEYFKFLDKEYIEEDKEKYQEEFFDSLNKKEYPIINKENLQAEYFKNLDDSNAIEDIANNGMYYKENEYLDNARVNYDKIKSLITFMAIIFLICAIIAIIIFLARMGDVQKGSNSIHISFHKEFGKKNDTTQNYNKKTNQEDPVKNDLDVAKNLFLNKITQEVKDYQLPEGITLDEKIKKIHSDIYNKLEWEISQPQFDPTYYFVTVYSPADSENFKQALYRFNYNTVSYTVEAMTLETKNMMIKPYQELIKN